MKVSKLATKVLASTAAGIAGIATVVLLTASGGTVSADGGCPDDMHWVVCPSVDEVADTVEDITDDITDGLPGIIPDDMHW